MFDNIMKDFIIRDDEIDEPGTIEFINGSRIIRVFNGGKAVIEDELPDDYDEIYDYQDLVFTW